jgi:prepilin-type N-terminal cleavage/methylation domain-containing protein
MLQPPRPTSQANRGGHHDGFTLVEVLATMTISALLLAALLSIASTTTRVSARVERQANQIEERTRLLAALAREVRQAAPIRWAGADGAFIFSGTSRSMAFAADSVSSDGTADVVAVVINAYDVVARRTGNIGPNAMSFQDIALGQPEAMIDDRYRVAFVYYARLSDGREALLDAWADPSQMPTAVRLTLSGRDGKTSTLRVKLETDAEPGCGFPKSSQCSFSPVTAPGEEASSKSTGGDGG